MYCIVNQRGLKLAMFTPNDLTGCNQLHYRRSWYIFRTRSEAEEFVGYIKQKGSAATRRAAEKLEIVEVAL